MSDLPPPPPGDATSFGEDPPAAPKFDPFTGQPLEPAEPEAQFDPFTGAPLGQPEPATAPRSKRRFILAAVALVTIAGVAVAVVTGGGSDKPTIYGMAQLFDDDGDIEGGLTDCEGSGGFADFDAGTDVKVRNEDGKLVGTGTLRNLESKDELVDYLLKDDDTTTEAEAKETVDGLDEIEGYACVLVWEAEVGPAQIYSIEVGDRGELTYRPEELEERDWYVTSTLGT